MCLCWITYNKCMKCDGWRCYCAIYIYLTLLIAKRTFLRWMGTKMMKNIQKAKSTNNVSRRNHSIDGTLIIFDFVVKLTQYQRKHHLNVNLNAIEKHLQLSFLLLQTFALTLARTYSASQKYSNNHSDWVEACFFHFNCLWNF